jgi:Tfp pilus assembly protein PilZ/ActR/RegA family two-component response regulator
VVNDQRTVFVVGFASDATALLEAAATTAGMQGHAIARCEDVRSELEDRHPAAIILRLDAPGAGQACTHVRQQARLAAVPIFGVVPERNDLAFTELFVWGADDLAALAHDPFARRLRALRPAASLSSDPAAPTPAADARPQPQAIVAGADASWRSVMGRALYNGGFGVRFAASAEGLVDDCARDGVRVVVASDDLPPNGGLGALEAARVRSPDLAWVLVAPPKRMAALHEAVIAAGRASVIDGFAAPENALFVVNELLAARGVDKRATARLLYGTAVAFRAAGRDEDEVGFAYNVSAGGLYVRTLAPLDAGQEVWLELWPPRSERRVRLAGRVAWKRPFGPVGGSTVPAGFGVQITDGLAGDLERWQAGYNAFVESLLGRAK